VPVLHPAGRLGVDLDRAHQSIPSILTVALEKSGPACVVANPGVETSILSPLMFLVPFYQILELPDITYKSFVPRDI